MRYCQTYNKSVAKGHGTLIGNWLEEEILRDASGHTHLERYQIQRFLAVVHKQRQGTAEPSPGSSSHLLSGYKLVSCPPWMREGRSHLSSFKPQNT